MSKRRKKTNKTGITCCSSEKQDKILANKRLRQILKQELYRSVYKNDIDINQSNKINKNTGSDIWSFGKDGKQFFDKNTEKIYYRK